MKYRPSNGTEGMIFMDKFCDQCVYDLSENCDILADTFCYDVDDPEYPEEWICDEDLQNPRCTKFLKSEL